ncbi:MAG TPA: hypothetical protein VFD82_09110 [Planctomycetota bacterium]|nr:hypothetical protein [Planctomycetota bacterium]
MNTVDEPWDPDAPLRERLIARGPAIAVLAAMIGVSARLVWLWTSGIIETEPFFGSTAWNLAIALPAAAILTAWWGIVKSRERRRERELSALMPDEPLSSWHRRIRRVDAKLGSGPPRCSVRRAR